MTAATAQRMGATIEQMREGVASMVLVCWGGLLVDIVNAVAFFAVEEFGYVIG